MDSGSEFQCPNCMVSDDMVLFQNTQSIRKNPPVPDTSRSEEQSVTHRSETNGSSAKALIIFLEDEIKNINEEKEKLRTHLLAAGGRSRPIVSNAYDASSQQSETKLFF